ncbi:MAG: heavy-metal-associated domain-containing protein [Chitinophagaceae bacterium]|jgi:cation transport ATPase|nr:MAG: heavy-metal-associated domain-containing protein [Chitinophagaceae bacterium]
MKKIFFLAAAIILSATGFKSVAQSNSNQPATIRIKTSVQCTMCRKRITDYFRREPGVLRVDVNYYNKIVTVRYIPSEIPPSYILNDIANLGYDADTVKANPDFYKKLPVCCQQGGGMEMMRKMGIRDY